MGQRHQIYVRIPAIAYKQADNPNNRPEKTIGIHHQWLYGRTALKLLKNFLTWIDAHEDPENGHVFGDNPRYWTHHEAQLVLNACYSVNVSEGYYHNVHTLGAECEDPTRGDNNDGITIIDLTQGKPKYCFMSIGHLDGEGWYSGGEGSPNFTPFTAEDYVTYYYPNWKQGKVKGRNGLEDAPEVKKEIQKMLRFFKDYELLTKKEVQDIFPKMRMK